MKKKYTTEIEETRTCEGEFQLGTHDPGPWSQHPWTKFSKCSLECRIHQTHFIKHFSLQFIEEIWIFVILLGIFDDKDDDDDDDYDDDDYDDDGFFFGNGWLTKDVKLFFPARMIAAGFSASQTCDTPRKGFSPAQNLSLGSVEWSCTVVIIATPIFQIKRHHLSIFYFI